MKYVLISLGILLIILLIVFAVQKKNGRTNSSSSKNKGDEGEYQISQLLTDIAHKYDCYQVDDVIIPEVGKPELTSQIDHILLTKQAIFVIETKNYSGIIYGEEDDQEWTQIVGDETHTFYSPYKQNVTHTIRLARLLHINTKSMYSFIVFVQDNIQHVRCKNVFGVNRLVETIEYVLDNYDEIFTEEELSMFYDKLCFYVDNPIETNEERAEKIQEFKE